MMVDWSAVGTTAATIIGGLSLAVTGFITGIVNMKKKVAEAKAGEAEAKAAKGAADADNVVYSRLTQEVDRLSERMRVNEDTLQAVRLELEKERQVSRKLEIKLARLDGFIRSQGLTPPTDI